MKMSKWEFMHRLEELLSDIAPGEREEALKYYGDYITDGGTDNETEVLKALGTPEQVAAIVRDGLEGKSGEFTEAGFINHGAKSDNPVAQYQEPAASAPPPPPKKGLSGGMIALIVILCIFGSPVIIGLGTGLFGLLVGLLAALFALIVAFGVTGLALLGSGIVLVFVGLFRIFMGPLTGFALISAGLIMSGLGLLFLTLLVLIAGKLLPWMIKGIGKLCGKVFKSKKGAQHE